MKALRDEQKTQLVCLIQLVIIGCYLFFRLKKEINIPVDVKGKK